MVQERDIIVMIRDETVEVAAKAMFAEEQCDRTQKLDVDANWRGRLDDRDRDEYRRLTRAALEAAAPHLLAAVADDLDREFTELRMAQGKPFDWLAGIADAEQHIRNLAPGE